MKSPLPKADEVPECCRAGLFSSLLPSALFVLLSLARPRVVFIIALLLLTAPVAAHLIARASYRSGVPLSGRTWIDELKKSKQ
jgi:monovalent cation/proton antiporter MnhG/PhaG subunit